MIARSAGHPSCLAIVALIMILAPPAGAHVVYQQAYTWHGQNDATGRSRCLWQKSEVSHGSGGGPSRP